MARYRTKPFEVEATQWNKPGDHPAVVPEGPDMLPHVMTSNGAVVVDPGDWIMPEPNGSGHYPCKPDIFAAKYEKIV